MQENMVLDDLETLISGFYDDESIIPRRRSALFVPNHKYFRNETLDDLRKSGHLPYPAVKMPIPATGYLKAKDNDCL
ncbi:MAG: hypothetical protein JST75_18780 [Bacteroidetes bacterium]|nr:hypothetical protein [Bacteroidota bacterium]